MDGPQGFFLLCKSLKTSSRLVTRFVYTSKYEILIPFIITYLYVTTCIQGFYLQTYKILIPYIHIYVIFTFIQGFYLLCKSQRDVTEGASFQFLTWILNFVAYGQLRAVFNSNKLARVCYRGMFFHIFMGIFFLLCSIRTKI